MYRHHILFMTGNNDIMCRFLLQCLTFQLFDYKCRKFSFQVAVNRLSVLVKISKKTYTIKLITTMIKFAFCNYPKFLFMLIGKQNFNYAFNFRCMVTPKIM